MAQHWRLYGACSVVVPLNDVYFSVLQCKYCTLVVLTVCLPSMNKKILIFIICVLCVMYLKRAAERFLLFKDECLNPNISIVSGQGKE